MCRMDLQYLLLDMESLSPTFIQDEIELIDQIEKHLSSSPLQYIFRKK